MDRVFQLRLENVSLLYMKIIKDENEMAINNGNINKLF